MVRPGQRVFRWGRTINTEERMLNLLAGIEGRMTPPGCFYKSRQRPIDLSVCTGGPDP